MHNSRAQDDGRILIQLMTIFNTEVSVPHYSVMALKPHPVSYKAHKMETERFTEPPKLVRQSTRETAGMETTC